MRPVCFGREWKGDDETDVICRGGLDPLYVGDDGSYRRPRCPHAEACEKEYKMEKSAAAALPTTSTVAQQPTVPPFRVVQNAPINMPPAPPAPPQPTYQQQQPVQWGMRPPTPTPQWASPPPPPTAPTYNPQYAAPQQAAQGQQMVPTPQQMPGMYLPGYIAVHEPRFDAEGQPIGFFQRLGCELARGALKGAFHVGASFFEFNTFMTPWTPPKPGQL